MKKILLLVMLGILSAGVICAKEMTVKLKSGNDLVIQYSGTIQGVTLQGNTDTIEGVLMNTESEPDTKNSEQLREEQQVQADQEAPEKKTQTNEIRWKWANPKIED